MARQLIGELYCDVGPAVLVDRSFEPAWSGKTFDQLIMDSAWEEAAARGHCFAFKDVGSRCCTGPVELWIDEAPPEWTRFAERSAKELRLEVPSGALHLTGFRAFARDSGLDPGQEDFLSVDVPPGTYRLDTWGFSDHAARVENDELLQPGEGALLEPEPPTKWSSSASALGCLVGVATFVLVVWWLVAWKWTSAFAAGCSAVAGLWGVHFVVDRLTGERRRRHRNAAARKAYLASLPVPPSYLLVLTPTPIPPREGGCLVE
jgi:hypothetical protein